MPTAGERGSHFLKLLRVTRCLVVSLREEPMRPKFAIAMLIYFTTVLAACEADRTELGGPGRTTRAVTDPFDPDYGGHQGVALVGGRPESLGAVFDLSSAIALDGLGFDNVRI